jgi:hypothetical protein
MARGLVNQLLDVNEVFMAGRIVWDRRQLPEAKLYDRTAQLRACHHRH